MCWVGSLPLTRCAGSRGEWRQRLHRADGPPAPDSHRSCTDSLYAHALTVVEQRQRRFSPVLDASVKHPELVAAHDDVGRPKHLSRVVRATLHVTRLNEDGPISNVCPVSQIATRHELDQVEACARRNVRQSTRLSPAVAVTRTVGVPGPWRGWIWVVWANGVIERRDPEVDRLVPESALRCIQESAVIKGNEMRVRTML